MTHIDAVTRVISESCAILVKVGNKKQNMTNIDIQ